MLLNSQFTTIFIDLDDTLYPEKEYLLQAYDEIGKECAQKFNLSEDELSAFLKSSFLENGREKLLNKAVEKFNLPEESLEIMLTTMRNFAPKQQLNLFEKSEKILGELIQLNKQIIVVTNGNEIQQKNKVRHIDWKDLDRSISFIYANTIEPKPSSKSFLLLQEKYGFKNENCVMIGDSETDKLFAHNSKIKFIHINDI
jgi:putative hydrolase of the HAD superfamily